MRIPAVLTRNFRLKLGCALLALITWAGVVYAGNPPETRVITVHVPQAASNVPAGFRLINPIPDLSLRFGGTRDHLNAFDPSSLIVTVDWHAVTRGGVQAVPVSVVKSDPNVDLLNPPTSVMANIDTLGSVSVQVGIDATPPPAGYRTTDQLASPSQVVITGPQHELHNIQARVAVDLTQQRANFQQTLNVLVYDSQGNRLNDVSPTPKSVAVSIGIASVLTSRAVAVEPKIVGKVASGYVLSGLVVSPPSTVISGPQDLLNGLGSVSTSPISINGFTGTVTLTVAVATGFDGVTANPGTVTVTLQVTALAAPSPTPTPTPTPTP